MLTQLRLKNWRSIKEETIDFTTPITVFIGANSSGKSNLIDTFYFLRETANAGIDSAFNARGWEEKIRTIGVKNQPIEVEISYTLQNKSEVFTYNLQEVFVEDGYTSWTEERLTNEQGLSFLNVNAGKAVAYSRSTGEIETELSDLGLSAFGRTSSYPEIQQSFQFISQRWQLLGEGFAPSFSNQTGAFSDPYILDRCAENLPTVLEFMTKKFPNLFRNLEEDINWLLNHVSKINTEENSRETRFYIHEKNLLNREAPTISAGTGRLVAILSAYYALWMRLPKLPGLVVIEEPDTALNPGLLQKFVSLLRDYTERENSPQQFILTTHNPAFLNYFEPEEVRVVERDEQGYTHVHRIPDHIKNIWLDEYALGEVWTTNSFGGLPE